MSKHVVIIGAGAIGLSAAYSCAAQGHKVTLLDRLPEERTGCSFGNAGMVVPSHFVPMAAPGMVALGLKWMRDPESPFYIQPRLDMDLLAWCVRFWRAATPERVARAAPLLRDLHMLSRAGFNDLAGAGLNFGLIKKGLLMLCKTQKALEEEIHTAAQAKALGIPVTVLDAKATAKVDPSVKMDIAGSVYYPKDCHLSSEHLLAALQRKLVRGGADIRWETDVTSWRADNGRISAVVTNHGEISGDEFVLCGGVRSVELARMLGLNLPMQAGKGYSLTLENPPQLPGICSILTEARVAITPMAGALRVGGTMEMVGLDESINRKRIHGIVRAIPAYFPEFREQDFDGIEPWVGLRPCSPDGLPYLGRTRKWANLICATGHAMMGISLAPGTGKIVAELVGGPAVSAPLDLLSPDRY